MQWSVVATVADGGGRTEVRWGRREGIRRSSGGAMGGGEEDEGVVGKGGADVVLDAEVAGGGGTGKLTISVPSYCRRLEVAGLAGDGEVARPVRRASWRGFSCRARGRAE